MQHAREQQMRLRRAQREGFASSISAEFLSALPRSIQEEVSSVGRCEEMCEVGWRKRRRFGRIVRWWVGVGRRGAEVGRCGRRGEVVGMCGGGVGDMRWGGV